MNVKNLIYCFLHRCLWALLVLGVTCASAQTLPAYSPGNDSLEWYYTLRPTDKLQDIGQHFLKQGYNSADLIRYNNITNPKALQPGTNIKVPVEWLRHEPVPAMATSVNGEVLLKRHRNATYSTLTNNTRLNIGDEVLTRNGSALIRFADGSILRLSEQSTLVFNRLTRFGKTGMTDTRMRLQHGSLSTHVKPLKNKNSRYEINTPSAVAAVRGTAFRLKAMADKSQLEVTEGIVNFQSKNVEMNIKAGEASILSPEASYGPRIALLAAPTPVAPISTTDELPIILNWQVLGDASKYRYEIYRNGESGDLIEAAIIEKPSLLIPHLDNGQYTVAMRGIDRQGIEGFNHLMNIRVEMQAIPATPIFPANEAIIDDTQPTFNWQYNGKNEYARIEIANDETFHQIIARSDFDVDNHAMMNHSLNPGIYFWRVVTRTGGSDEMYSAIQKVTIKGSLPTTRILTVSYDHDEATLFWKKLYDVNQYQVQVAEDPQFIHIISSQLVEKNYTRIKLTPGKQYFARVRAVENDFYLSQFSPERVLLIR